jgi:hypothetical protein
MAWYDIFRAKKEEAVEIISSNYDAFSTPFLKVGGTNLSLPYVNGRYTTAIQIGFHSVKTICIHSCSIKWCSAHLFMVSIVDYKTNAVIGGGFELKTANATPKDLLELYTFEKKIKLKKTARIINRAIGCSQSCVLSNCTLMTR